MRVRWTQPAVEDFIGICDYTEVHFGALQARRAALQLFECAESLKVMPQRGRNGRKPGTRELTVSRLPFVIVYRSRAEGVEILRILHGAQRWP